MFKHSIKVGPVPVFLALVCLAGISPAGWAQEAELRYSRKLAEQLVPSRLFKQVVGLEGELVDAAPSVLIESHPIPLQEVAVPTTAKPRMLKTPTSWQIPPFPDIPPPVDGASTTMPDQLPAGPRPDALAGIPVYAPASYSVRLRPKMLVATGPVPAEDMDIPQPFSRIRYATQSKGLFQLTLYGGTTSFAAEQAFAAVRNAVSQREPLEGVGQEAFLGHLHGQEPQEKPPVPRKTQTRFDEIPVLGAPRPDLLDPGADAAKDAPAFQDVPTSLSGPEKIRYNVAPPAAAPAVPAIRTPAPNYLTLVAYLPEKALTLEMVVDERLSSPQALVELALRVVGHLQQL